MPPLPEEEVKEELEKLRCGPLPTYQEPVQSPISSAELAKQYPFIPVTRARESERSAAVCDGIMEDWEEERPSRATLRGTDTPTGRAAEVMGTAYAKSIGIEMLPFEVIPHMLLDNTPQLLRLREEGADYVNTTAANHTLLTQPNNGL